MALPSGSPWPGKASDITARLIWGNGCRSAQPFVIENRLRAGTNVATEAVVNATERWNTMFRSSRTIGLPNATPNVGLKVNFIRDLAPIACIMRIPNVMVVNPSPFRLDPVALGSSRAKANPGKITVASL